MRTLLRIFLLISLSLLTDAYPEKIFVRAGDMVALHCPIRNTDKVDTNPTWTSYTPHKTMLTSDMKSHLLLHKRSLILLSVSVDQQGNYSCSMGNNTFWFKVSVTREFDKRVLFSVTCYTQNPCSLKCPVSNTPASNTPNMTRRAVTWTKDNKTVDKSVLSFSSVEETDHGVYTCTRSYLYHGQIFNMSFTNILTVKPQEPLPDVRIHSPQNSDVNEVDLGSPFVLNCTATLYSAFDEIYWMIENSSVDSNDNARIHTKVISIKETDMTASLIFKNVLKEDLSKHYTCKLEPVSTSSSYVTVSLAQKRVTSWFPIVGAALIILVIVVTASCTMFKMDIYLYLRDRLGCHSKCADPKAYDAYLLSYKSESDLALSEDDTVWLKDVLENHFGYKLHPKFSAAEAIDRTVLDRILQSRAVILVPTASNSGPVFCPDLSALEEHKIHVIHIKTETESRSTLKTKSQLQDASPLLRTTEQTSVVWKGNTSRNPSSVFCKELRYHLPPSQHHLQDSVNEV